MKEGYWINYETESVFLIDEHERWIRRYGNADKLGVPVAILRRATRNYTTFTDRNDFLIHLMQHAPIMRVRGHGDMITFEFHSVGTNSPIRMIYKFGEAYLGTYSIINVFNFASSVSWRGLLPEFADACCADCCITDSRKDSI